MRTNGFGLLLAPRLEKQARTADKEEVYANYHSRMSEERLKDMEPFATNRRKPYLEIALWLIVVYKKIYDLMMV